MTTARGGAGFPTFAGVLLAGGRSRRMGRDKAFVEVDGVPLAELARRALLAAGSAALLAVGGDADALADLGWVPVADRWPGEGPLGGIVTALLAIPADVDAAMVVACDLPLLTAEAVAEVVRGLAVTTGTTGGATGGVTGGAAGRGPAACVPSVGGRLQVLHAAYHRCALGHLEQRFAAGERSAARALEGLDVRVLPARPGSHVASSVVDADTPADLERHVGRRRGDPG